MDVVTSLHVIAALFIIGPLVFVTSATPRALRAGQEGIGTLRFLTTTTRVYALASPLVLILGAANVRGAYSWSQLWVWLSTALFVVALALQLAVVVPAQRRALAALESGGDSRRQLGAIGAGSGVAALAYAAIVFLMIYKTGL